MSIPVVAIALFTMGSPLVANAQTPASLVLNATTITGGRSTIGQLTLSGAAGAGGLTIQLASSNPAVVQVQAPTAPVSPGISSLSFAITSSTVLQTTVVTISATAGGASRSAELTIMPPVVAVVSLNAPANSSGLASITGGLPAMGTVALSARAPASGIIVQLSSSNSLVAGVPPSVTIPANAATAGFGITSQPLAQPAAVNIIATTGEVSRTLMLTVAPPAISRLELSPGTRGVMNLDIGLDAKAPPGGVVVKLSLSDTTVARLSSPSVTIIGGAATVTITTVAVAQLRRVTLTGSTGGVVKTLIFDVLPPRVESVSFLPDSGAGGTAVVGRVNLNGPAPSVGIVVRLQSSDIGVATVPPSVTIPAGGMRAEFAVRTVPVQRFSETVFIDATAGESPSHRGAQLTVLPPELKTFVIAPMTASGGATVTGQVTLNGPAAAEGRIIQLTASIPFVADFPSSVTVPAGATTKSFSIQTHSPIAVTVAITASAGGINKVAQLPITP
jgi:hypothetical protein